MLSVDVQVLFSKNNTLTHKSMCKAIWLMRTRQETPIIHSDEYGNELPLETELLHDTLCLFQIIVI